MYNGTGLLGKATGLPGTTELEARLVQCNWIPWYNITGLFGTMELDTIVQWNWTPWYNGTRHLGTMESDLLVQWN